MVDVDIKGVLNRVGEAQLYMREQDSGHFVNIRSVAGHKVPPNATINCATRYAFRAFNEGIRRESDGSIRVTSISPGAVKTEMAGHIGVKEIKGG